MRPADIEFTQGIYGFQVINTIYDKTKENKHEVLIFLRRTGTFCCCKCGSKDVSAYVERERKIQAESIGRALCYLIVQVHKFYCRTCSARSYESLPFISSPTSRVTRNLERAIIELRREMSILAISEYFNLSWHTVKNIEKEALSRQYSKVKLKNVKHITIDEIYVFRRTTSQSKYITVVRDLETGAVLEVARGKGVESLSSFYRRIRRYSGNVTAVCMDMSKAYCAWVFKYLPNADIIFDHFHVIKAVNDKLDQLRRRAVREMDEDTQESIKGNRRLFLRSGNHLSPDEAVKLEYLNSLCKPLATAYMLKEKLRSIYMYANNELEAGRELQQWCSIAQHSNIREMISVAKMVQNHFHGILAYWRHNKASNASHEGFNNKIRWLIRQAYGFRDYEYFRLKIFHLPKTDIRKRL